MNALVLIMRPISPNIVTLEAQINIKKMYIIFLQHYCPVFPSRCEALLRNVACLPAECAFYMTQEGLQAALGNQETKPIIGRICQYE